MTGYKNSHKKKLFAQEGQVAVIFALLIVCLLGMTALVVDLGSLYQKRGSFQTVADSAALAGAQELFEDPNGAKDVAVEYAVMHNVNIDPQDVKISSTYTNNDTITVTPSDSDTPLLFGGVLGINNANVGASATAMVGKPIQVYGVVPWAAIIPAGANWKNWLHNAAGVNKEIKVDSTNFYAWGDVPGEPYGNEWKYKHQRWIINGYPNPLSTGNNIYIRSITSNIMGVEMGAIQVRVGGQKDSFGYLTYSEGGMIKLARSDTQFVIIPLIYKPAGSSEKATILGFAPFIVLDWSGNGSKAKIIGKFIDQAIIVNEGNIGAVESAGLRVIRLIR